MRSEHDEQTTLFRWALFARPRHPELALLFAIPNGGQRHKAVAARMKAEGVRAGVPDLCLPVARGGFHGLYLELKTAAGTVSRAQRQWLQALAREGYRAEVCKGWQAAKAVIEDYLGTMPVNAAQRQGGTATVMTAECSRVAVGARRAT
jgi:hypothetical protein